MAPESVMTVMIVEDDAALRETLGAIFRESCEAILAADAPEGLRLLEEGATPDVILLDLALPGTDGAAFILDLRSRGVRTPIVVMSGRMEGLSEEARAVCSGFLEKPFKAEQLWAAISLALAPTKHH